MIESVGFLLIGALAGLFFIMFGVGGGFFIVPALTLLYHLPSLLAVQISLSAVFMLTLSSLRLDIERRSLWGIAGTLSGALFGAFVIGPVQDQFFYPILGALVILGGVRLFFTADSGAGSSRPLAIFLIGMLAGTLSILFGIGGGVVAVPLLSAFGESYRGAVLLSQQMMVGSGALGATLPVLRYHETAQILPALIIGIGAIISSRIAAGRITPRRKIGGVFFILLGLATAFHQVSTPPAPQTPPAHH